MNNRFQHHTSKNIIFQRATDYKKQQIFKNNTEQQLKKGTEKKTNFKNNRFKKNTKFQKTTFLKTTYFKKNRFQNKH